MLNKPAFGKHNRSLKHLTFARARSTTSINLIHYRTRSNEMRRKSRAGLFRTEAWHISYAGHAFPNDRNFLQFGANGLEATHGFDTRYGVFGYMSEAADALTVLDDVQVPAQMKTSVSMLRSIWCVGKA